MSPIELRSSKPRARSESAGPVNEQCSQCVHGPASEVRAGDLEGLDGGGGGVQDPLGAGGGVAREGDGEGLRHAELQRGRGGVVRRCVSQ